MAEIQRISVGALNVTATPHPKGVYAKLLNDASDIEVPVWGSDWASLTGVTRLKSPQDNWLRGRIIVWTRIDRDGSWLNKKKKDAATREEKKKLTEGLPADFEPNYRSFNFVFVEDKHRFVVEAKNEIGESFGISRAEKFLSRLFSPDYLPKDAPVIEVTVIPEEESLEEILSMPGLRRLEILIKTPNPDVSGESYEAVMKELTEQGARSQKIELIKAPGIKAIIPNEKTQSLAAIGATDGYVSGEGKDQTGRKLFESTQDHPKIRHRDVVDSSLEVVRRIWTVG